MAPARQGHMGWIGTLLALPLDFALPHRCAGCGTILGGEGAFCPPCWASLTHLEASGCPKCLTPMAIAGQICGPCLHNPPAHDGVLAALRYGAVARTLALRLKYGRRPGAARVMAGLMRRHAQTMPDALLVPVPLHRWRLWWRGFNQSAMIAGLIARMTGQHLVVDALLRRWATRPLGGLGRAQRRQEVAGVFALNAQRRDMILGRDILLVDDVYTTGATANACALVLKRAGARSVRILCWARVLQDV